MSTIRAPQVDPRRAPAPRRRAQPDLQVVRTPARHTHTRGIVTALAIFVVFAALLASAVFHALLAQGQQRLDKLHGEVATQQDTYQRLRYEVAQLSAPQAVVAAATALGLHQPASRTLITPPAGAVDPTAPDPNASGAGTGGTGAEATQPGESPWSFYTELKPFLGSVK